MSIGKVILGGIRYRLDSHEGMATFVECDRMSCARITVQKREPQGLLYVQASSATGFVPFAHVAKAVSVAETMLGPNHFASLESMHRFERGYAASHVFKRPIFSPLQRLFWTHDIPFRFASIWRAARHHWRLLFPYRGPHVEWEVAP